VDLNKLIPCPFDLSEHRFGTPQSSGALTAVPIFGPEHSGLVGPLSHLKLSGVHGYGNVELTCSADSGIAIVPLHMGYIQDGAQNHALCGSGFLAAGQKRVFSDACCVQAAQCGYLQGREQWFFIMPLPLRDEALQLRGKQGFNKLWMAIARVNEQFGLAARGHLEQILSRKRAYLTQYQSRLELLPEQKGALFFLREKLVGIEIAPNEAYFAELWMPLVCFCYGAAAMLEERCDDRHAEPPAPFPARTLEELRDQLRLSRLAAQEQVRIWLARTPAQTFERKVEERRAGYRLITATNRNFAGQFVETCRLQETQPGSEAAKSPGPSRRRLHGLARVLNMVSGGHRLAPAETAASHEEKPTIEPISTDAGRLVYASLFARPN
jgi:hypothetical protein